MTFTSNAKEHVINQFYTFVGLKFILKEKKAVFTAGISIV